MSNKFVLDKATVGDLLKGMGSVCETVAKEIAGRAGEGYEVTTHIGKTRVNASVHPATKKAKKDNLKNNTLLKAVGR